MAYNSMKFDKCMESSSHHHQQDAEEFRRPQNSFVLPFCTIICNRLLLVYYCMHLFSSSLT